MGSGSRLDLPCQILSVCAICNSQAEADVELDQRLQKVVANMEGVDVATIKAYLHSILRLPKGSEIPKAPWRKP
jgi:hypothetical protein